MANTDLQLNTTITLKDEFSSQMGGFASSVGRLHGMLESLNTTMNKISHIASTPMNNNFSNGLASIGRSAHRANIELTTLNNTLTRTIGLASRTPSGGVTATAGATGGGTRGLGAIRGYRGILSGVTRALSTVSANFFRGLESVFSIALKGLESVFSIALRGLGSVFSSDLLKNNLVTALVGAFGSVAVLKQAQKLFEDATKQMTVHQRLSHLDFVAKGETNINDLKDSIFGASMRSKTNYLDFAQMVQSIGARAGGAFGSSGELIQFTEQLQKMFTADSDMSSSERVSTIVRLSKALTKGQLEGRELNEILYQTPSLINLIAKTLGKTETEIYKLASEGQITANVVKKAVFDNVDEINKKFLDMPDGWGEVMIRINNYAQHAFQGVYQKITDIFTAERIQKIGEKIAPIFYNLASIIEKVIDGLTVAIDWTLQNINSLLNAFVELGSVVTILGTILGLVTAINFVMASGPIGWALSIIGLLEGVTVILNSILGTSHTLWGYFVWGVNFLVAGIGYILNAVVFAIAWVIGQIGKLLMIMTSFSRRVNSLIIWSFKNAWIFIKSLFLNGINNLFQLINNLAKGTVNILFDVVNGFLEPLEKRLSAIIGLSNKITGKILKDKDGALKVFDNINFDLKNQNTKLNQSLKNEAQKANREKQKDLFNIDNEQNIANYRIDDTLRAMGGIGLISDFNKVIKYANDMQKMVEPAREGNWLTKPTSKMLKWDNVSTGFDKSKVLNDIKSNTDDIKNNTDFSKYLREMADRQTINKFTSPTLDIKFTNNNNINKNSSIDDIVATFSEQLREALTNSTQGALSY